MLGEESGGGVEKKVGAVCDDISRAMIPPWLSPTEWFYFKQVRELTVLICHIKLFILSNQLALF